MDFTTRWRLSLTAQFDGSNPWRPSRRHGSLIRSGGERLSGRNAGFGRRVGRFDLGMGAGQAARDGPINRDQGA